MIVSVLTDVAVTWLLFVGTSRGHDCVCLDGCGCDVVTICRDQ